jgi:NADH-quinone oxidoreductase subunit E
MSTVEDFTKAYRQAMPEQFAGAANLMAHPLAGMAAAGALGLGLAGHAFGMWAGAVAGAAEASQKLFSGLVEGEAQPAEPAARLRLVASQPAPRAQPVARAKPVASKKAVPAPIVTAAGDVAATPPAAIERPEQPDDLKAIAGIGPKLEKTLNGLGIWTYAQVASLTEAEIAWLDGKFGLGGRIGRDGWTGQAAGLSAGK